MHCWLKIETRSEHVPWPSQPQALGARADHARHAADAVVQGLLGALNKVESKTKTPDAAKGGGEDLGSAALPCAAQLLKGCCQLFRHQNGRPGRVWGSSRGIDAVPAGGVSGVQPPRGFPAPSALPPSCRRSAADRAPNSTTGIPGRRSAFDLMQRTYAATHGATAVDARRIVGGQSRLLEDCARIGH